MMSSLIVHLRPGARASPPHRFAPINVVSKTAWFMIGSWLVHDSHGLWCHLGLTPQTIDVGFTLRRAKLQFQHRAVQLLMKPWHCDSAQLATACARFGCETADSSHNSHICMDVVGRYNGNIVEIRVYYFEIYISRYEDINTYWPIHWLWAWADHHPTESVGSPVIVVAVISPLITGVYPQLTLRLWKRTHF